MQYSIVALVVLAATAIPAFAAGNFHHDANAPDGIYAHYIGDDGSPTSVLLAGLKPNATHANERRGYPQGVNCQSSILMNAEDLQSADNQLASIFGGGLQFFHIISAKSGSAVAYGCDYGHGQVMSSDEFLGYMLDVSTECGASSAGFYNIPNSKSAYGRTNVGISFC